MSGKQTGLRGQGIQVRGINFIIPVAFQVGAEVINANK
jgi:hypothetical protein